MSRHLSIFALLLLALAAFGPAAQAQASVPPFAWVQNGVLTLVDAEGSAREIMTAPGGFPSLAWNAGGTLLAFLMRDENYQAQLGVVEAASGTAALLDTPAPAPGFSLNWTRDGRILFAAYSPTPAEGQMSSVDIFAVAPQAGAQAERLGTVLHGTGCGGGSPYPTDWVYTAETEGFGGYFLTLADTAAGILYSGDCGGASIGLLDPASGESALVAEQFAKVIVSPDGARAAGVEISPVDRSVTRVLVYDLAALTAVEVQTVGEPDQMAWSRDGQSLYYSLRTPEKNLLDGLSAGQKAALSSAFGFDVQEVPGFAASIRRHDLASGEDSAIYSGYSYAVGRMVEAGDALYFSVIPNLDAWVTALAEGKPVYDTEESRQYAEPSVLRLAPAESPEAALLGMFEQFTPVVTP